jgi:hypothetical protein
LHAAGRLLQVACGKYVKTWLFGVFEVIPSKAGIQSFLAFLDSRLRGSDGRMAFFSNLPGFSLHSSLKLPTDNGQRTTDNFIKGEMQP